MKHDNVYQMLAKTFQRKSRQRVIFSKTITLATHAEPSGRDEEREEPVRDDPDLRVAGVEELRQAAEEDLLFWSASSLFLPLVRRDGEK